VPRVLLIAPTASYRASDFFEAAESLGIEVAVAAEQPLPLVQPDLFLSIDCQDPEAAAASIVELASRTPIDAIVPIDDTGVIIAALASEELGLVHNPPQAARATRDKSLMRSLLGQGEINQPRWKKVAVSEPDPGDLVFPLVVKPLSMAGSQGVIKVDRKEELLATVARVGLIAEAEEVLLEEFAPGPEVSVEGMLWRGQLEVLAVFDKPDPLAGPYFEETIYVTPSSLPQPTLREVARVAEDAAGALGLTEGPIHAELRVVGPNDVRVIEVAGRSIGGICGRSLSFGLLDTPLEALILRHALGRKTEAPRRGRASGVMMIPIPRSGVLVGVEGTAEARSVEGVQSIEITTAVGAPIRQLPEADGYLGFIFAKGKTPAVVEAALRKAHAALRIDIKG
jgi:biotin carboxylase